MTDFFHVSGELLADLKWSFRAAANLKSWLRLSSDFVTSRLLRLVKHSETGPLRRVQLRSGVELNYRLNRADIWTIHEIWVREIYRIPVPVRSGIIVDLGTNIGLAGLWFAKQFGCLKLFGAEPSATNHAVAQLNLERNGVCGGVYQVAVGAEDGEAVFMIGQGATNGRIDFQASNAVTSQINSRTVRIWSMSSLLSSLDPTVEISLMKIDIEGGEQNLLSAHTEWLSRVRVLVCEFHPQLVDYQLLQNTLAVAGLRRVAMRRINEDTVECFQRNEIAAG